MSGVAQQQLSKAVFTCRHYSSVTEMLHQQRVDQDEDERCKDDQDRNEGGDGDRSKSNDDYCDSLFFFQKLWQKLPFFLLLTTPFSQGMKFHSHMSRFLFNHSSSFFFTVPPPLCPVCACVCVCVFYSDDVYYFHCKGPQGGGSQVVPL